MPRLLSAGFTVDSAFDFLRQADRYPENCIIAEIEHIITNFKPQTHGYERLYKYLLPNTKHTRIPQSYDNSTAFQVYIKHYHQFDQLSLKQNPHSHTQQI